jgi:IS5 family transposase
MRPKQPKAEPQDDLFRARLENLVDPRHALVRLAELIDWRRFEAEFGALYTDGGRPGLPTRLMVGLHLLKHMDGLSDEAAYARYLDSPYVQLFCGETFFQHALPLDRSSLTRWRQRIGAERLNYCWPRAWPLHGAAARSRTSTCSASPSTPRSSPRR